VPYQLLHEKVDIRLTATTVEALHKGERVAAHVRSSVKGGYTTIAEHMPPEHRFYAEWNPARFVQWAGKTGASTARLVEKILAARPHPEQAFKSCLGIIHLARDYEPARMEAAAERAIRYNACSYRSVKAILATGLDRPPHNNEQPELPGLLPHQNIRGQAYYEYHNKEENCA
jgi:transposase